jgi:putative peptidoglycan lipid II flippase
MRPSQGRLAARVGAGILVTRVLGFVRERVFAHYFGTGVEADAFGAALRIPNVIRNLLGEGTLSASFIPVYAGMIERGETEDARRLSGVIVSLLVLLTAIGALLGVLLAPVITDFAAPGFTGRQRDLTVTLVKILFPMSGALILSAWCLGILNTHRRFFLAYSAPAVWNIAQIATLVALGSRLTGTPLVVALAWGAVAGSLLQILVQLPLVLRLINKVRWSLRSSTPGVRPVVRAWIPVIIGAGVVQISSIVDTQLASLLGPGAVATLRYAQLIAILPVSLFGVSVAAVALPELSRDVAVQDGALLRLRIATGLRQVAFFAIPSAFALAALGPQLAGALFQTGAFDSRDTELVGGVLAAYALAVPAQASIKLLASGHYAQGNTKTPVRIAVVAVVFAAASAFLLMRYLGAAGIALGAAAGAYTNAFLNYAKLRSRLGSITGPLEIRALATVGLACTVAAAGAMGVVVWRPADPVWLVAVAASVTFCLLYGAVTVALANPEARKILSTLQR